MSVVDGRLTLRAVTQDKIIVDYFTEEFNKKHKVELRDRPKAMVKLAVACEKVKRTLSMLPMVRVLARMVQSCSANGMFGPPTREPAVQGLLPYPVTGLKHFQANINMECLYDDYDLNSKLERDTLAELAGPIYAKILPVVEKGLELSGLSKEDLFAVEVRMQQRHVCGRASSW
eukprot:SAG31_NODE_9523_length_1264_cov_1.512446_1_plen_174_part_00